MNDFTEKPEVKQKQVETVRVTPVDENRLRTMLLQKKATGTLRLSIAGGTVKSVEFESHTPILKG